MRSRIFNIMQYELHPETNEVLLTEDQIKIALSHKTIKRWAYIAHDKDHYSDADFDDDNNHTIEKVKPKHWHIVAECSQQLEVQTIAKWFGIKENFIDCPKGNGAFMDCVEYLTHENPKQIELDKHHYSDDEIKSNFDFREELQKRADRILKYGKEYDPKIQMMLDIQENGMTLSQARKKDPVLFGSNYNLYTRARSTFLDSVKVPDLRLNFYVWSKRGGDGKGLASRAIARSMFPGMEDDEIMFFVNSDTKFNGYDGQPVLIWNDFRAYDLLKTCGGRGALFDLFDSHPVKQAKDVKYSKVNLVNSINIVNSIQPYVDFLNGLAGEYKDKDGKLNEAEDKGQAYRRFPFIAEIKINDYDYLINKGFIGNSQSYIEYETHKNVKAGFKAMHEMLGNNETLLKELETKALTPLIEDVNKVKDLQAKNKLSEEEARAYFADVGKSFEDNAAPLLSQVEEQLNEAMAIKRNYDDIYKSVKWNYDHDCMVYKFTEDEKNLLISQPKGAQLLFDIMSKFGSSAVVMVEKSELISMPF